LSYVLFRFVFDRYASFACDFLIFTVVEL
jgi:hypothetical protein